MGVFEKPTIHIRKKLSPREHAAYDAALASAQDAHDEDWNQVVEFTLGAVMAAWVVQCYKADAFPLSIRDLNWFGSYGQMCSDRGDPHLGREITQTLISHGVIPTPENLENFDVWLRAHRSHLIELNQLKPSTDKREEAAYLKAFILSFWQGHQKLAVAYWGLGVIAPFIWGPLVIYLSGLLGNWVLYIGAPVIVTWTTVSIWRCADNVKIKAWGLAARIAVVVGVFMAIPHYLQALVPP